MRIPTIQVSAVTTSPAIVCPAGEGAFAALLQISGVVPDQRLALWASQLAPVVAIEAIIAWLDAGQPDPDRTAARVRQAVMGVIGAAVEPS